MPTENRPADPFGPNSRTFHIHLSVRGALRDFSKRQLKGMFLFEGARECTADEAKDHLLEALAQGKEVLPFGPHNRVWFLIPSNSGWTRLAGFR